MTNNVVYLGKEPRSVNDDDADKQIKAAVRQVFLEVLRQFRSGEIKATLIIALEKDGSVTWRAGGLASDFEIVAALERTKLDWLLQS